MSEQENATKTAEVSQSDLKRVVINLRNCLKEQIDINKEDIDDNRDEADMTSYYYFLGKETGFDIVLMWLDRQGL